MRIEEVGVVGCNGGRSLILYMFGGGEAQLNSKSVEYTGGKRALVVIKRVRLMKKCYRP